MEMRQDALYAASLLIAAVHDAAGQYPRRSGRHCGIFKRIA